jgi:hypothetical protein
MVQLLRSTSIGCAALFIATVTPALADEYATNYGPVGPNEPIIAAWGGQRVRSPSLCPSAALARYIPSYGRMKGPTRLTARRASG